MIEKLIKLALRFEKKSNDQKSNDPMKQDNKQELKQAMTDYIESVHRWSMSVARVVCPVYDFFKKNAPELYLEYDDLIIKALKKLLNVDTKKPLHLIASDCKKLKSLTLKFYYESRQLYEEIEKLHSSGDDYTIDDDTIKELRQVFMKRDERAAEMDNKSIDVDLKLKKLTEIGLINILDFKF